MDTPGYDPVAATGQVAGGANVIVLHHRPRLGLRLQADALDQARHQHRHLPPDDRRHGHQLRRRPRRRVDRGQGPRRFSRRCSAVASGEHTKSEDLGYGDNEFVPWQIGAVM